MNKKQRKEKLATRQRAEKEAVKKARKKLNNANNIGNLKQNIIPETKKKLTFVEKLEIWTKGFTAPVLDIDVVLSENKNSPKFSGLDEYEMYEKIKREFEGCLIMSKNDVAKAWELFRKRYVNREEHTFDDER